MYTIISSIIEDSSSVSSVIQHKVILKHVVHKCIGMFSRIKFLYGFNQLLCSRYAFF